MFYIETELLERDGEWEVVSSAPVKVIAWDRDKYFLYEDSNGNLLTTKGYHLSLKRSNKIHKLPYIDWLVEGDEHGLISVTNKEAQQEIKRNYKRKTKYVVNDITFNSLKKAFNYAKNIGLEESFIYFKTNTKRHWFSGSLMVKEEGKWFYYLNPPEGVSEKTLKSFCEEG